MIVVIEVEVVVENEEEAEDPFYITLVAELQQ